MNFRRKKGEWKLILRHADPLAEKTKPPDILQSREAEKA